MKALKQCRNGEKRLCSKSRKFNEKLSNHLWTIILLINGNPKLLEETIRNIEGLHDPDYFRNLRNFEKILTSSERHLPEWGFIFSEAWTSYLGNRNSKTSRTQDFLRLYRQNAYEADLIYGFSSNFGLNMVPLCNSDRDISIIQAKKLARQIQTRLLADSSEDIKREDFKFDVKYEPRSFQDILDFREQIPLSQLESFYDSYENELQSSIFSLLKNEVPNSRSIRQKLKEICMIFNDNSEFCKVSKLKFSFFSVILKKSTSF